MARGLLSIGIAKGQHVGIWATNYTEWVLAQFATAKIGAVLVTVNPGLPHQRTRLRAGAGADWRPHPDRPVPRPVPDRPHLRLRGHGQRGGP